MNYIFVSFHYFISNIDIFSINHRDGQKCIVNSFLNTHTSNMHRIDCDLFWRFIKKKIKERVQYGENDQIYLNISFNLSIPGRSPIVVVAVGVYVRCGSLSSARFAASSFLRRRYSAGVSVV